MGHAGGGVFECRGQKKLLYGGDFYVPIGKREQKIGRYLLYTVVQQMIEHKYENIATHPITSLFISSYKFLCAFKLFFKSHLLTQSHIGKWQVTTQFVT